MSTVLGFEFIAEDCLQCHACELGCASWRGLEDGMRWRRVSSYFTGTFPDTKLVTVSVSCLHCAEAPCGEVCPAGAIRRQENGAVVVDSGSCVGCRLCVEACPVGAPQFAADGTMQKCDMCIGTDGPYCAAVCPSKAIRLREMTVEEKAAADAEMLRLLHHD